LISNKNIIITRFLRLQHFIILPFPSGDTGKKRTVPRILLIDDDRHIAEVVEFILVEQGFEFVHSPDGDAGLAEFRRRHPDLILLDLKLPGLSGLDLFSNFRREGPEVPVIMLTSLGDEVDRVIGLELGADDYVTKPFSPRELAARVRAVLRRATRNSIPRERKLGPLEIAPDSLAVKLDGIPLDLTVLEFRLLENLCRYPARVFSREALIDRIYPDPGAVTDRSIDTAVKKIRAKFRAARPGFDPIETVYGEGYRLNRRLEETG